MNYEIEIIRSSRKTLSIQVTADGRVIARAPMKMKESEIRRFAEEKSEWIEKNLNKALEKSRAAEEYAPFTPDEIREMARRAVEVIPERVAYYAKLIGVTYGRITIRNQKTRWGSCTSRGNLNFNCLLMMTPPEVIDSVVVHELCHRKELNHSKRFYNEVLRVYPDYYVWDKWLKDNGGILIKRMTAALDGTHENDPDDPADEE